MKHLLIMRHAKSSWKDSDLEDHDRPLNKRGLSDAPRMGRLIKQEGLVPDLVISSTALRAATTAREVADACGYSGEIRLARKLYLAHPSEYLDQVRELDDGHERVMLVGHNPGMEDLVEMLTGADEPMTTANLAHITLDIPSWTALPSSPHGTLTNLWRPKELDPP